MNRRTLLSIGLLLVVVAVPQASADQTVSCQEDQSQEGCQTVEEYCADHKNPEKCNEKVRAQCAKNPEARKCADFIFDELCKTVVIYAGTPQLGVWDPILGIIEIHEDSCTDYYRETADGGLLYMFTYEKTDGFYQVHREHA